MTTEITTPLSTFITTQILKQPGRTLTPDEKIISSGLIDSFSLVDLSIFIEDTFGVRIEDTELNADTFDTLAELSELIRQRQSAA
jgi:acyl carrier protein